MFMPPPSNQSAFGKETKRVEERPAGRWSNWVSELSSATCRRKPMASQPGKSMSLHHVTVISSSSRSNPARCARHWRRHGIIDPQRCARQEGNWSGNSLRWLTFSLVMASNPRKSPVVIATCKAQPATSVYADLCGWGCCHRIDRSSAVGNSCRSPPVPRAPAHGRNRNSALELRR